MVQSAGRVLHRLGAMPLIQGDPRPGRTIQQPLEVKAGKLIVDVLSNMRRERRHCARIASFEISKGLQVALRRWISVLLYL